MDTWRGNDRVAGTNTKDSSMKSQTGLKACSVRKSLTFVFPFLCILAWSLAACPPAWSTEGYTQRFTVVNNCGDNAWMWIVPPGPDLAEAQSQFWETVNGATKVCKSPEPPACATRNYQWKINIPAGATVDFEIPDAGSASNKYYFNLGCVETSGDYAQWGNCKIGGAFGATDVGLDISGSNTWLEVTWGCKSGAVCVKNPSSPDDDLTAVDWMDISVVDGYTIPMTLTLGVDEGSTHNCQYNTGDAWDGTEDASFLDFASCPKETADSLWTMESALVPVLNGPGLSLVTPNPDTSDPMNCVAPYKWFSSEYLGDTVAGVSRPLPSNIQVFDQLNEVNWYGCKAKCGETSGTPACVCPECDPPACLAGPYGNTQKSAARTNYVRYLKAMGMKAYTWQYDDNSGNKHCDQGVHLTLTLCPAKAEQKPYEAQIWQFNAPTNKCLAVSSTGPDTYASYYDCITDNARYELVMDHNVPYCVPDISGKYDSFAECNALLRPAGSALNLLLAER
jgi:hypothetical protein